MKIHPDIVIKTLPARCGMCATVIDQSFGVHTNFGLGGATETTYATGIDGTTTSGPATTFQFTSDGSSSYTLFIRDSSDNGITVGDNRTRLNGIDLVYIGPVPEPSTTSLLGLSSLALILRRRR